MTPIPSLFYPNPPLRRHPHPDIAAIQMENQRWPSAHTRSRSSQFKPSTTNTKTSPSFYTYALILLIVSNILLAGWPLPRILGGGILVSPAYLLQVELDEAAIRAAEARLAPNLFESSDSGDSVGSTTGSVGSDNSVGSTTTAGSVGSGNSGHELEPRNSNHRLQIPPVRVSDKYQVYLFRGFASLSPSQLALSPQLPAADVDNTLQLEQQQQQPTTNRKKLTLIYTSYFQNHLNFTALLGIANELHSDTPENTGRVMAHDLVHLARLLMAVKVSLLGLGLAAVVGLYAVSPSPSSSPTTTRRILQWGRGPVNKKGFRRNLWSSCTKSLLPLPLSVSTPISTPISAPLSSPISPPASTSTSASASLKPLFLNLLLSLTFLLFTTTFWISLRSWVWYAVFFLSTHYWETPGNIQTLCWPTATVMCCMALWTVVLGNVSVAVYRFVKGARKVYLLPELPLHHKLL